MSRTGAPCSTNKIYVDFAYLFQCHISLDYDCTLTLYCNNSTMKIAITLQSSDGEQFKTDIAVAKKSKTLRTMLEDLGVEEDTAEDNEIKEISPLPNMKGFVLDEIIDWFTQHLDEKEPDLDKPHPDAKDYVPRKRSSTFNCTQCIKKYLSQDGLDAQVVREHDGGSGDQSAPPPPPTYQPKRRSSTFNCTQCIKKYLSQDGLDKSIKMQNFTYAKLCLWERDLKKAINSS